MSAINLPHQHLALLRQLLAIHVPSSEVWAYGSRVSGGCHETSDLDIVLRNPKDLTCRNNNLLDIQEALQMSTIPIIVDVHDWANLPESFHQQIEREYVVIKEAAQDE